MLARRVFGRDAYWQTSATFNNKAQPLQKKRKKERDYSWALLE